MRYILFYILLLLPFAGKAWESDDIQTGRMVRWGVKPSFNINIPGGWTSKDVTISYGGGIGGVCNISWPSNWYFEPGVSFDVDGMKLKTGDEVGSEMSLTRCSLSTSLTGGYLFEIDDLLNIAPLAGVEFSYFFSNHASNVPDGLANDMDDVWKPVNLSCGVGFDIVRDNISIGVMGYFGLIDMKKRNCPVSSSELFANRVKVSVKYYF